VGESNLSGQAKVRAHAMAQSVAYSHGVPWSLFAPEGPLNLARHFKRLCELTLPARGACRPRLRPNGLSLQSRPEGPIEGVPYLSAVHTGLIVGGMPYSQGKPLDVTPIFFGVVFVPEGRPALARDSSSTLAIFR
jgi:hypothetical protein